MLDHSDGLAAWKPFHLAERCQLETCWQLLEWHAQRAFRARELLASRCQCQQPEAPLSTGLPMHRLALPRHQKAGWSSHGSSSEQTGWGEWLSSSSADEQLLLPCCMNRPRRQSKLSASAADAAAQLLHAERKPTQRGHAWHHTRRPSAQRGRCHSGASTLLAAL